MRALSSGNRWAPGVVLVLSHCRWLGGGALGSGTHIVTSSAVVRACLTAAGTSNTHELWAHGR